MTSSPTVTPNTSANRRRHRVTADPHWKTAQAALTHAVSRAVRELRHEYGYSFDRAAQAVFQHLEIGSSATAPVEQHEVSAMTRRYGIGSVQARLALAVARTIQKQACETKSAAAVVEEMIRKLSPTAVLVQHGTRLEDTDGFVVTAATSISTPTTVPSRQKSATTTAAPTRSAGPPSRPNVRPGTNGPINITSHTVINTSTANGKPAQKKKSKMKKESAIAPKSGTISTRKRSLDESTPQHEVSASTISPPSASRVRSESMEAVSAKLETGEEKADVSPIARKRGRSEESTEQLSSTKRPRNVT
jgi:hypothetical protein